jgi:hypothetical protein
MMLPITHSLSTSRNCNPLAGTTTDDKHEEVAARQRIPRDVWTVSHRLDHDQANSSASFDSLHGELTKITAMMANMQATLYKTHPLADPPPAPKTHNLHTPPPLPNHPLSPIVEETTPLLSSVTSNAPPFPPK